MSHGDFFRSQKKSTHATSPDVGPEWRRLDAAYRATAYRIDRPPAPPALQSEPQSEVQPEPQSEAQSESSPGHWVIRIGARHPAVDEWLGRVGAEAWNYLSAENPGSRRLSSAENRRRTAGLRQDLIDAGKPFLPGQAIADAGDWPPESGFLVGGLDEAEAATLAGRWGQNALVGGRRKAFARLIWLVHADPADDTMP